MTWGLFAIRSGVGAFVALANVAFWGPVLEMFLRRHEQLLIVILACIVVVSFALGFCIVRFQADCLREMVEQ
jgi:hypothetical protein